MATIDALLQLGLERNASDVHVRVGSPPLLRVHGHLQALPDGGTDASAPEALLDILTEEQLHLFEKHHDLDFAYEIPEVGRFRVNFLRQRHGIGAVFRIIPSRIPAYARCRRNPARLPGRDPTRRPHGRRSRPRWRRDGGSVHRPSLPDRPTPVP